MEKIGQVLLDDTLYPGKDLYTDGAIEDEMLWWGFRPSRA